MRRAAIAVFHLTNIPPDRIEAYSLCSGGATTLLVSGINEMAICALRRWKSDAIFLYLRTQPSRLTFSYARSMLSHGQYTFSPSATDYDDKDLLPREAPDSLATTICAVDRYIFTPFLGFASPPSSPPVGTYMGYTRLRADTAS